MREPRRICFFVDKAIHVQYHWNQPGEDRIGSFSCRSAGESVPCLIPSAPERLLSKSGIGDSDMRNIAVTSILVLLVIILTGFPAAAETVIQINGGLPVQTQDEALLMIAGATRDYLQDPEVAAELEAEITSREFSSPFFEDESDVMTEYTLTHQGNAMRFLMNRIGQPNADGRYPLFITLHGGGEAELAPTCKINFRTRRSGDAEERLCKNR